VLVCLFLPDFVLFKLDLWSGCFPALLAKMYLHQYDYIFAIGTLFAMLDAYNNGASEYIDDTSFEMLDTD